MPEMGPKTAACLDMMSAGLEERSYPDFPPINNGVIHGIYAFENTASHAHLFESTESAKAGPHHNGLPVTNNWRYPGLRPRPGYVPSAIPHLAATMTPLLAKSSRVLRTWALILGY